MLRQFLIQLSHIIILTNAMHLGIAKVVFLTFITESSTVTWLTWTLACKLQRQIGLNDFQQSLGLDIHYFSSTRAAATLLAHGLWIPWFTQYWPSFPIFLLKVLKTKCTLRNGFILLMSEILYDPIYWCCLRTHPLTLIWEDSFPLQNRIILIFVRSKNSF